MLGSMANDVYNGIWTNWEQGRIKGATLTLPVFWGLVLVSFLTLYVQFAGACFWRVLCFILHQARSTTIARDGLFHQQQAILRNSITAPFALWSLLRSALAWAGQVKSPFSNSLPLILITILHLGIFTAAGLFTGQVTKTNGAQALVHSEKCGFHKHFPNIQSASPTTMTQEELLTFNTEALLGRLTLSKSANYVRTCYNIDPGNAATECNLFVQPYLMGVNYSAVYNATCPFGSDACHTQAARYDSGHIHSNEDLGINYPKDEGLTVRRVTSCAPIKGEQYSTDWVADVPEGFGGKTNTSAKFYDFGHTLEGSQCDATNATASNDTTFCVTEYMKDYFTSAYTIQAVTSYHENTPVSDFVPVPNFKVPNADVTLIGIFSKVKYIDKVDDRLFEAHKKSQGETVFYTATDDLSILGCTEQYQFCNSRTGVCTDLTGLYGIRNTIERGDLGFSSDQQASYEVLWNATWAMGLQWAFRVLGENVFLAGDWVITTGSQTSSPLPPRQWETEAENLHNISLAVLQRRTLEYARPEIFQITPNITSRDRVVEPTEPNMKRLCGFQKVRSSDHHSISVLGMAIILGVGSFLILLDWVFIQQIFWFRSVILHSRQAKKDEWCGIGTLELHRKTLQAKGIGPWETKDYEFPVLAERGVVFGAVESERDMHIRQMYAGGTGYDRGRYAALQNPASSDQETHGSDEKWRDASRK